MSTPHIVFVSHDASRTGAPIFLLHLLGWLKEHTDWSFELVCQRGGPLVRQFRRICPVTTYRLRRRWRWLAPLRFGRGTGWLRARVARSQPCLVYYNTVACGEVREALAPLGLPTIVHVHELESVIQYYGADTIAQFERSAPEYIAASGAVAANLRERHAVPADRLRVVHEFIRLPEVPATVAPTSRASLCDRLGIPQTSLLVAGMGSIVHRKGVDLFVDAARQVRERADGSTPPIHFLWVGSAMDRRYAAEVRSRVRREGLGSFVHFLGSLDRPLATIRHCDLFALTSREDPYPLAMLEAGALGLPVVGFAGSGGAPEFIEHDAGIVVPWEDTTALADAILTLAVDPDRRQALGAVGAAKVRARHTLERAAIPILNRIAQQAARSPHSTAQPTTLHLGFSPEGHPSPVPC